MQSIGEKKKETPPTAGLRHAVGRLLFFVLVFAVVFAVVFVPFFVSHILFRSFPLVHLRPFPRAQTSPSCSLFSRRLSRDRQGTWVRARASHDREWSCLLTCVSLPLSKSRKIPLQLPLPVST